MWTRPCIAVAVMAVIVIIFSCLLVFFLVRADGQEFSTSPCQPALDVPVSTQNTHIPPHDGTLVRNIVFSSCYKPEKQIDDRLWKHFRQEFVPKSNSTETVWCWLGDNMYEDTNDMNRKREAYNAARDDIFYATSGPVAEPKIPTTGTWDGMYCFVLYLELRRVHKLAFSMHPSIQCTHIELYFTIIFM